MVHVEEIMLLFLDPFASITHIVTVGDSSVLLTREQQTKIMGTIPTDKRKDTVRNETTTYRHKA